VVLIDPRSVPFTTRSRTGSTSWRTSRLEHLRPSDARVYDYLLGGKDNYAADRAWAEHLLVTVPDAAVAAQANRAFLTEAVDTMARAGVRQFLDLGAGIPFAPNVHETARAVHPDACVVYVDHDPVVIAHDQALLATEPGLVALCRDLREPDSVLQDVVVRDTLDLDRPVGLLLVGVLDLAAGPGAARLVERYLAGLPAGSMLAVTAACTDGVGPGVVAAVRTMCRSAGTAPAGRGPDQIRALFTGLRLLPPGLHDRHRSATARVVAGIGVLDAPGALGG